MKSEGFHEATAATPQLLGKSCVVVVKQWEDVWQQQLLCNCCRDDFGLFYGINQCKSLGDLWEKIMVDMEKVEIHLFNSVLIVANYEVAKMFKHWNCSWYK